MSLQELATKVQIAVMAPPDPPAGELPPGVTKVADKFIGMMITFGGIVAVACFIAAAIMFMFGDDTRGGGAGAKIMKVLLGVAGVLGGGWIIGTLWTAAGA